MRSSNMQSAAGRLQEALDDLKVAWENTRDFWNDQQADKFEATYLKTISEEVAAAFPAIGHVAQTFGTASRDCSE